MLVFISGGVRSGKSSLGEELAQEMASGRKIYLATSKVYDEEMAQRVRLHQEQRSGKGYITIEKQTDIGEIISQLEENDTVLMDCLGNLLANEMFSENPPFDCVSKIFKEVMLVAKASGNMIIISNDVFSDGCGYSKEVLEYIDNLADLHKLIVAASDTAIECAAGTRIYHKN